MRLRKLTLKNIRSYTSKEINFPDGSLLLSGDIGSGKTSLLLAIEYALFGLQPGQTGSALLRNGEEVGEVILEFESEGREIIIERRLRRGNKSVTNEFASLSINGEENEYSITEIKTRILEIMNYPSEFIKKNNLLYKYTVYTPQEQMKQIILEDVETRLNILRHVFGVDKYKTIRENASIAQNKLKEEIRNLQFEIKTLEEDRERLGKMKENINQLEIKKRLKDEEVREKKEFRREKEKEKEKLESSLKERERLETELEKTKFMIANKKENLYGINKEIDYYNEIIRESDKGIERKHLEELDEQIIIKKRQLEQINEQHVSMISKINNLKNKQSDLIDKKTRVFKIDICPTCLQNVPDFHKHNILNETEKSINELNKEIGKFVIFGEESEKYIGKIRLELMEMEKNRGILSTNLAKQEIAEKSKRKLEDLEKSRNFLIKDIEMLDKHIYGIKEEILIFSKFLYQYKIKNDELKKAFLDEKNSEIAVAELKKEVEITRREVEYIKKSIEIKEKYLIRLQEVQRIFDWISNYFLSLIDYTERNVLYRLRQEFSRLLAKWFNMLAGEGFDIRLDENFAPVITQGEFEMDYSFLSGGERTAVALSYRLALNQTINSIMSKIKTKDIVILDEPTEGFSEAQVDKMRDIFSELNVGQLIIVSHEPKIESFVDNVTRLKKGTDSTNIESSFKS
jgi:DNA repair protein SbcC/Rad50